MFCLCKFVFACASLMKESRDCLASLLCLGFLVVIGLDFLGFGVLVETMTEVLISRFLLAGILSSYSFLMNVLECLGFPMAL
jgi:hypothetical protein